MNSDQKILDSKFDSHIHPRDIESNVANRWNRFLNLIFDYIFVCLIFFILAIIAILTNNIRLFDNFVNPFKNLLVPICLYIGYTMIFEYVFKGKTIGKFITRTKVVKPNGNNPYFINLLGKNLARLIPFDGFSYLGSHAVGWHDKISDTIVIND